MLGYHVGANSIQTSPPGSRYVTNPDQTIKAASGLFQSLMTLLSKRFGVFEGIKRIIIIENIQQHMEKCRAKGDAGLFAVAVEVVKYKDLKTGPKKRQDLMEECYEQLRPRVMLAVKSGYIKPLQDPPCRRGWGSFNLYKEGRFRRFDTNRYLPCFET